MPVSNSSLASRPSDEGVFLRKLSPDEALQLLARLPLVRWHLIPGSQIEWPPVHQDEPSADTQLLSPFLHLWWPLTLP